MMKKALFLVIIMFLINGTFAQSKSETISWIVSKFNKWKVVDQRGSIFQTDRIGSITVETPLSLTITNCTLVFTTKFTSETTPSKYDLITYTLNLGDVENIEWVRPSNTDYLILVTRKSMVKSVTRYKSEFAWENDKAENSIEYFDRVVMAYNINGEDDFKARMVKAYNHLRKYCTLTPKTKEVF
jgi:hypothetical protein